MELMSYAGTETTSDHKIVNMKTMVKWTELYRRPPKQEPVKQIDTTKLVNDEEARKAYREKLDTGIEELNRSGNLNWNNIKTELTKAEEETIGHKTHTKTQKIRDPEIEAMSNQQKKLRLVIENSTDAETLKELTVDLRREQTRTQ